MNVALLLAAGASTRFGSPKQVSSWRGEPLVASVAKELAAAGARGVVVTGAHDALVRRALQGLDVDVCFAERWAAGPGASIKAGLSAVPKGASAVLVTLCDLPHVTREDYRRLLEAPGPLAAAAFDGTVGAPAVFRAPFLERLAALDDGAGARRLLQAHRALVTAVECPAAALDLDVPEAR